MRSKEEVQQQMFKCVEQCQQSGLSQKTWCAQHAMRYHVFHYWYKRYRDAQAVNKRSTFIPLKIKPCSDTLTAPAELLLPDGKRLLFHQPVSSDYLKSLIS
jgi:hypothetical protein